MFKKFKNNIILILLFIADISLSNSREFWMGNNTNSSCSSNIVVKYFSYPSNLIAYSISGSSLIEFKLNKKGEIENLHIVKSLGYPFDTSILAGLDEYVSNEIMCNSENFENYYRLEIKFGN
tara:strand:- start:1653 stop:2018 length:366 start_codon:yes stop_codon:yes gene_type:complete